MNTTKTTTNFKEWLNGIEDQSIEEMFNLFECINQESQRGSFTCKFENNFYYVKNGDNDITLILSSELAKNTFLKILDDNYGGDLNSIEMLWDLDRIKNKND